MVKCRALHHRQNGGWRGDAREGKWRGGCRGTGSVKHRKGERESGLCLAAVNKSCVVRYLRMNAAVC
jgi:hypothetical protein